jgi:hypothetical protein
MYHTGDPYITLTQDVSLYLIAITENAMIDHIQYLVNVHGNLRNFRITHWTFYYESFMIKAHTGPQTIIT